MYEAHKIGVTVKCPYYKHHEKGKIVCEGIVSGSNMAFEFQAKTKREAYIEKYCGSLEGCKECKLHEILDEKWGVSDKK